MKKNFFKTFLIFSVVLISFFKINSEDKSSEYFFNALSVGISGDLKNCGLQLKKILIADIFNIRVKRSLDILTDCKKNKISVENAKILLQGFYYYHKSDFKSSIEEYKRSILLNSKYYLAHHNLGSSYYQNGQNTKSINEYKIAIKLNPTYAYTFNNLGLAYNRMENYSKAVEMYKKAVRLKSSYYKAYNNLGVTLFRQKKNEESQKMFAKALNINKNYSLAFQNYDFDEDSNSDLLNYYQSYSNNKLRSLMEKGTWVEKKIAVFLLSKRHFKSIPIEIIDSLKNRDSISQILSIKILEKFDTLESTGLIIGFLSSENWNVRYESALALGNMRNEFSSHYLHKTLLNDKDFHVREAAAIAIYRVGDPESIFYLKKALNDKISSVRNIVLWVLANKFDHYGKYRLLMGKKINKIYRSKKKKSNKRIETENIMSLVYAGDWSRIIEIGEPAVKYIEEIIKTKNPDFYIDGIIALGEIGCEKCTEILKNLLITKNPKVKFYIAQAFEKINDRSTIPLLIELLEDSDWKVRKQALMSLNMITGEFLGEDKQKWELWWEKNQ